MSFAEAFAEHFPSGSRDDVSEKEFHNRWEYELRADPWALWPLVSDTNRFNRDAGLPDVARRDVEPEPGRASRRRLRPSKFGVGVEWDEEPFEWVAPLPLRRRAPLPDGDGRRGARLGAAHRALGRRRASRLRRDGPCARRARTRGHHRAGRPRRRAQVRRGFPALRRARAGSFYARSARARSSRPGRSRTSAPVSTATST